MAMVCTAVNFGFNDLAWNDNLPSTIFSRLPNLSFWKHLAFIKAIVPFCNDLISVKTTISIANVHCVSAAHLYLGLDTNSQAVSGLNSYQCVMF